MHQEHNARRSHEQWEWRARVAGEAATRLRARARYHVCRKMSHKPEPRPSQPPAVRGYGGAGAGGREGRGGPHAGGRSPAATLAGVLGDIRGGVVALVSGESGDGQAGRASGDRAAEGGRSRGGDGGGRG